MASTPTKAPKMRAPKMDVDSLAIAHLFDVANKVVVVTGGSTGIGKAIAFSFVRNGAKVYITARDAKACEISAAEMNAAGPGKCIAIPGDISTEQGK
jgi:NAD(P)-dependent dehydrogenase (short-subunit alcohol dehydrogenase family)